MSDPNMGRTPSPVAETAVDTSSEAVERLIARIRTAYGNPDGEWFPSDTDDVVDALRALAAERDAAVARASEHGAYRTAAAAFLASKGLLPEFDAWCEARGMPADAVGALVAVARAARGLCPVVEEHFEPAKDAPLSAVMQSGWFLAELSSALDALPSGILDHSEGGP